MTMVAPIGEASSYFTATRETRVRHYIFATQTGFGLLYYGRPSAACTPPIDLHCSLLDAEDLLRSMGLEIARADRDQERWGRLLLGQADRPSEEVLALRLGSLVKVSR